MTITIDIPANNAIDCNFKKMAIEKIAKNFNKENLQYIAELSEKPGVNEKFDKLKSNPMIKSFL